MTPHREAAKAFYAELKAGPCAKCGGQVPVEQKEWHHVYGRNKWRVSQLWYSRTKLLEEVAKCVLLCRQCHQWIHEQPRW